MIISEPPSAPRGPISITNQTDDSAEVKWQPPEYTGGTPIINYIIEIREATRTAWRRTAVIEPTRTSFTIK